MPLGEKTTGRQQSTKQKRFNMFPDSIASTALYPSGPIIFSNLHDCQHRVISTLRCPTDSHPVTGEILDIEYSHPSWKGLGSRGSWPGPGGTVGISASSLSPDVRLRSAMEIPIWTITRFVFVARSIRGRFEQVRERGTEYGEFFKTGTQGCRQVCQVDNAGLAGRKGY